MAASKVGMLEELKVVRMVVQMVDSLAEMWVGMSAYLMVE